MHHRSFGLAALASEMIHSGDRILDLGPLSSGTTGVFLKQNCQCHIEDLVEYLSDAQHSDDPLQALEQHLIPKPGTLKYDVILCWDILNFLSLELIDHLFKLLAPHLKQGTLLHVMRYTGTAQPKKPRRFRMLDDFQYEYVEDPSYPDVASQGYSTVTLLKRMSRFSLMNSLMKREGMDKNVTEHLFEYDSVASRKQVRSGGASDVSPYFSDSESLAPIELPGLSQIVSELQECSSLLDCGKKNGRNIEYLQKLPGKFYIEDLHSSISWQRKIQQSNSDSSLSESVLRFDQSKKFNAVLLWDILSFCCPEQISQLGELLLDRVLAGAKLHLLMMKVSGLPDKPAMYEVVADGRVKVSGAVKGCNERLLLSTADLLRLLPRYKISSHHFGRLPSGDSFLEFVLQIK